MLAAASAALQPPSRYVYGINVKILGDSQKTAETDFEDQGDSNSSGIFSRCTCISRAYVTSFLRYCPHEEAFTAEGHFSTSP